MEEERSTEALPGPTSGRPPLIHHNTLGFFHSGVYVYTPLVHIHNTRTGTGRLINPNDNRCLQIEKARVKMTGHSKMFVFCRVSPINTRLFCYITCTFKRTSLWLFRFKFHNLSPLKICKICKKGTNC